MLKSYKRATGKAEAVRSSPPSHFPVTPTRPPLDLVHVGSSVPESHLQSRRRKEGNSDRSPSCSTLRYRIISSSSGLSSTGSPMNRYSSPTSPQTPIGRAKRDYQSHSSHEQLALNLPPLLLPPRHISRESASFPPITTKDDYDDLQSPQMAGLRFRTPSLSSRPHPYHSRQTPTARENSWQTSPSAKSTDSLEPCTPPLS